MQEKNFVITLSTVGPKNSYSECNKASCHMQVVLEKFFSCGKDHILRSILSSKR